MTTGEELRLAYLALVRELETERDDNAGAWDFERSELASERIAECYEELDSLNDEGE